MSWYRIIGADGVPVRRIFAQDGDTLRVNLRAGETVEYLPAKNRPLVQASAQISLNIDPRLGRSLLR